MGQEHTPRTEQEMLAIINTDCMGTVRQDFIFASRPDTNEETIAAMCYLQFMYFKGKFAKGEDAPAKQATYRILISTLAVNKSGSKNLSEANLPWMQHQIDAALKVFGYHRPHMFAQPVLAEDILQEIAAERKNIHQQYLLKENNI